MTLNDTVPTFLGDDWLFDAGWSFAAAPSADLTDATLRTSSDPWDRFLSVFAQAKRGDFSHGDVLASLLEEEQPHPLFLATMYLGAAIGGAAEQAALVRWLGTPWFTQAASALELTGDLAVVEPLLARRRSSGDDMREEMESSISRLLELEPDRFYDTGLDDDAYDALVRAEGVALAARHEPGYRFSHGAPLRPRTLVAKLEWFVKIIDKAQLDEAAASLGAVLLHTETLTGLPVVGIVTGDDEGNDSVDRSRLRRYIDDVEAWDKKHKPRSGKRMFFGHLVPER